MKTYTVQGGTSVEGIALKDGKVLVGEEGRGRKLVSVAVLLGSTLAGGSSPSEQEAVLRVIDVPASRDKDAQSIILLVKDHSGYRGSWRMRAARTPEQWDDRLRREAEYKAKMDAHYRQAETEGEPYRRKPLELANEPGWLEPDGDAGWRTIAEGYCADGAAGRMGGGPEYLAVLRDGQAVEVVATGRRAVPVVRLECRNGELAVSQPRKDAEERAAVAAW